MSSQFKCREFLDILLIVFIVSILSGFLLTTGHTMGKIDMCRSMHGVYYDGECVKARWSEDTPTTLKKDGR